MAICIKQMIQSILRREREKEKQSAECIELHINNNANYRYIPFIFLFHFIHRAKAEFVFTEKIMAFYYSPFYMHSI